MSNRERWIVYPLLFLALGTSLRDKFTRVASELDADRIRCRTLFVENLVECRKLLVGPANKPSVILASVPVRGINGSVGLGGVMTIQGADGRSLVELGGSRDGQFGEMHLRNAAGATMVSLGSTPTGGLIAALDAGKQLAIEMGHFGQGAGVIAANFEGVQQQLTPLVFNAPPSERPQPGQPPEPADE